MFKVKIKDGVPYVQKGTVGEAWAMFGTVKTSFLCQKLGLTEYYTPLSKTRFEKLKADRVVVVGGATTNALTQREQRTPSEGFDETPRSSVGECVWDFVAYPKQ